MRFVSLYLAYISPLDLVAQVVLRAAVVPLAQHLDGEIQGRYREILTLTLTPNTNPNPSPNPNPHPHPNPHPSPDLDEVEQRAALGEGERLRLEALAQVRGVLGDGALEGALHLVRVRVGVRIRVRA